MEPLLIIKLMHSHGAACCYSCSAKAQSDRLAPVWVISSSPFVTFIVAVVKRCTCIHKALAGCCLFNTFLSHWQACTNLIYPWVTVANIPAAHSTHTPALLLLWSLTCFSSGTYWLHDHWHTGSIYCISGSATNKTGEFNYFPRLILMYRFTSEFLFLYLCGWSWVWISPIIPDAFRRYPKDGEPVKYCVVNMHLEAPCSVIKGTF